MAELASSSQEETLHDIGLLPLPPIPKAFLFHRLPVALPVYQGPGDLLVWLLKRRFLDLNEVPIADVARSFSLNGAGDADPVEDLAVVASLAYIKSSLLLSEKPEEEEEQEPQDGEPQRQMLRRRALQNAVFSQVACFLEERARFWSHIVGRCPDEMESDGEKELILSGEPTALLLEALRRVLTRLSQPEVRFPRRRWTVSMRIRSLIPILKNASGTPVTFESLCSDCTTPYEIIVTFLALLELVRTRQVVAWQARLFDCIFVLWRSG